MLKKTKQNKYIKQNYTKNKKNKKTHSKHKKQNGGAMASANSNNIESHIKSLADVYKKFFDDYFEQFTYSEFSSFIGDKYFQTIKTPINLGEVTKADIIAQLFIPEKWILIITDLFRFFNILYNKMNRAEQNIHIFSASTGTGFLEALFAIYLKIIHKKPIVKIMFFDPYDTTVILNAYNYSYNGKEEQVFNYVIGLFQKLNLLDDTQIYVKALQLERDKLNPGLLALFKDANFQQIDIFITIQAQNILNFYNYNSSMPKKFKKNLFVKILNLYINFLTKNLEHQKTIPMLWLYYRNSLDFTNETTLIESMKQINKKYIDEIKEEFSKYELITRINEERAQNAKLPLPPLEEIIQNYESFFNLSTLDHLWQITMYEKLIYPQP